jgi:hypothetical protein
LSRNFDATAISAKEKSSLMPLIEKMKASIHRHKDNSIGMN